VFGIIITLAFLSIFLFRKILKQYFFIFKNLFLTLVHQNDSKTLKKFNLKQKKSNFNKKKVETHSQTPISFVFLIGHRGSKHWIL